MGVTRSGRKGLDRTGATGWEPEHLSYVESLQSIVKSLQPA